MAKVRLGLHQPERKVALERKMIYSTDEVRLAMKLILGERVEAPQVRRSFFAPSGGNCEAKFVPVNSETVDWAHHVFDRMVFEGHWQILIR